MFKNLNLKGFSFKSTFILAALFIMLFTSYSVLCAQAPEWKWVRHAGSTGIDEANAVEIDADGNLCVIGNFQGSVSFGSTILSSNGYYDLFVAKMDHDGNWLWAVSAGGTEKDDGRNITVDDAGNVYITGSFKGTAYFGGSITLNGTSCMLGQTETIFVAKLDPDGNWQWAQKAGAWAYDWGDDLVVDSSGNCYVTGCFLWYAVFGADTVFTDNFEMNASGFPIVDGYHWDIFVAKLNPDGNWVWEDNAGGFNTSPDEGHVIAFDPSGNLGIAGKFAGTAYFGSDSVVSQGGNDVFVAKMDTAGNWLGVASAGGVGGDYCWGGLDFDADGNAYIIGEFNDTAVFGSHSITTNGDTFSDIFVAKLGANYEWQWAYGIGGIYIDFGLNCVTDADGNTYVTGMFEEEAIFGATTLATSDSIGDCDVFAAKIDTDGNWQWAVQAGNVLADYGRGIALYNDCLYVVGSYEGTVDFGANQITNAGGKDIYVAKLSFDIISVDFNGDDYVVNSLSNYPNPFRNTTTISYSIKGILKSELVQISIYNMLGQLVDTVEGRYGTATWNTKDHSTGIYFYKLNTDSYTEVKKMMVTK